MTAFSDASEKIVADSTRIRDFTTSPLPAYTDANGVERRTVAGINDDADALLLEKSGNFDERIAEKTAEFDASVDDLYAARDASVASADQAAAAAAIAQQISLFTSSSALDSKAAQTAVLPANAYSNGSAGVGATITASANGTLTTATCFDGVTLNTGDTAFIRLQPSGQNWLYTFTQGSGSTPWVFTRLAASDTAAEIGNAVTNVLPGGALYGSTKWRVDQAAGAITVGTTALTFSSQAAAVASLAAQFAATRIAGEFVDDFEGYSEVYVDSAGKMLSGQRQDGTTTAPLPLVLGAAKNGLSLTYDQSTGVTTLQLGTTEGVYQIAPGVFSFVDDFEGVLYYEADSAGSAISVTYTTGDASTEVIAARGTKASLNERLSVSLRPDGLPIAAYQGAENLRDLPNLLQTLAGNPGSTLQPSAAIALFGDSYTAEQSWPPSLRNRLIAEFGDGGIGWIPFTNTGAGVGISAGGTYSFTKTGDAAWTGTANIVIRTGRGPDTREIATAAVGDRLVIGLTTHTFAATCNVMYLRRAGGGSFRWQVVPTGGSLGAWSSDVSTDNGGADALGQLSISVPASGGTIYLETTNEGTNHVVWFGGDHRYTTKSGIVIHRLAQSGSTTDHYAALPAMWDACVSALGVDCSALMWMTNDRSGNMPLTTYSANIQTIINRLRAIRPQCDIIAACAMQNLVTGKTYSASDYSSALQAVAAANSAAYIGIDRIAGPTTNYDEASWRKWFLNAEPVHPATTGVGAGRAYALIAHAFHNMITARAA